MGAIIRTASAAMGLMLLAGCGSSSAVTARSGQALPAATGATTTTVAPNTTRATATTVAPASGSSSAVTASQLQSELLPVGELPGGLQWRRYTTSFTQSGGSCPSQKALQAATGPVYTRALYVSTNSSIATNSGKLELLVEEIIAPPGPASAAYTAVSSLVANCHSILVGNTKVPVSPAASPLTGITSTAWAGSGVAAGQTQPEKTEELIALKGNRLLLLAYEEQGGSMASFATLADAAVSRLG